MGKSFWLCGGLVLAFSAPSMADEYKIPVVNEAAIDAKWMPPPDRKLTGLAYPAQFADHKEQVCLAIGFMVNPDGYASDLGLIKSWSSDEPRRGKDEYWGAFASVASAELSQWRFVPKPEGKSPGEMYTVATFVFASPSVDESSKRCAIPSLVRRIRELMQSTRSHRRMASSGVFSRLALDPTLEMRNASSKEDFVRQNMLPKPPEPPPPPPPPTKP